MSHSSRKNVFFHSIETRGFVHLHLIKCILELILVQILFYLPFRASNKRLPLLARLLYCQLVYTVVHPSTDVSIFLNKRYRFGLIAVVQSASVLRSVYCRQVLIIFNNPNYSPRQPYVFFSIYPFEVVAPRY